MTTIATTDPNIVYSPYTWNVASGIAKTICAGAYLRVLFDGDPNTLTVGFDVTNQPAPPNTSRVGIRIDGGPWQDSPVAASVTVTMPTTDTYQAHLLELVVISTTEGANRWNAPQNTAVVVTGITGDVTLSTRTSRPRPLRVLAFGDSITEGVRTISLNAAGDVLRNDARIGWAYPLGEALGAEVGVVGFGATGLTKAGSGNVPKFVSSIPYLYADAVRDTTSAPPDIVIGHVGSNDLAASDAQVTADTTALCNWLIGGTPARCPILILPGWALRKASAIAAGVAACSNPNRVKYIDTTGWWNSADASDALHPYGYINLADLTPRVANVAATEIASAARGSRYICGPDGEAIPI